MSHICSDLNCQHESHIVFDENKLITKRPFVQCHLHSFHSNLDGAGALKDYIKIAKDNNLPGFALTDHGNPAGLFDFWRDMKKAGLKPILGLEFYMAKDLLLKEPNNKRELQFRDSHQSLFIKDKEGYGNFCKLTYHSFTDGYYYKPRIDYDMLFQHKKGLMATSSCMVSFINQCIKHDKLQEAEELFKKFAVEFGDDFYGEIQFNEITDKARFGVDQRECNAFIIKMCNKYDVQILIGGDVHYATKADSELQDIIIQSKSFSKEGAEKKESFIHAKNLFFHLSEDYYRLNKEFGFHHEDKIITQALDNSLEFIKKCNFDFETGKINFPKYKIENNVEKKTNKDYLEDLAFEGLKKKIKIRRKLGEDFSDELLDKYAQQIEFELKVINDKNITDYFLIVADIFTWVKQQGYRLGPGRGSAAGALIAYAIDITEVDPLKHGLYFERFQNPERNSLPDIDFDAATGVREKIRKYLEEKYGKDCVFGVATFGTFGAKSSIQDVSRGLNKETGFETVLMREVTKLKGLDDATDLVQFFKDVYEAKNTTANVKTWIETNQDTLKWANKLLGQVKNIGTHAGGILITPGPVYNYIPVTRGAKEVVTAFKEADGSSKDLSELGLLKLDVLGLKTLNVIQDAIDNIKKNLNIDLTDTLLYPDLEDKKVLDTAKNCDVLGVFQLDMSAIPLIKDIKPDSFEDLVAISAINRPGPKETFGPLYGKWKRAFKKGNKHECESHENYPKLDFMRKATEETYGCLVYQEQFMLMVKEAAGFNMGEADDFRRAIAWKEDHPKYYLVAKYFDKLREEMLKKGYTKGDVDYFVSYCRNFMGYSFNKAHSLSYAYISYQCLYLKTYYPLYFYCAYINYEAREDYQKIVGELLGKGINILPPHISKSKMNFIVENGAIRTGFTAIKGFGDAAVEKLKLIDTTGCKDKFEELKVVFKNINSGVFKSALDCGCFDEYELGREKVRIIYELYKDPKIEKWFTRKKQRLLMETMPPSLKEFGEDLVMDLIKDINKENDPWKQVDLFFTFDTEEVVEPENKTEIVSNKEPHEILIEKLIPHIDVKEISEKKKNELEETLLGFSFAFAQKINQINVIKQKYSEYELLTLSERKQPVDLCVWILLEKTKKETKRGSEYWVLKITDGSTTINAKCWDLLEFKKDSFYISRLNEDDYGFTIITDNYLQEVTI